MIVARLVYAAGVAAGAATGFLSPYPFLGFVPLSAGLIWAALNLVEVDGGEPPSVPKRPRA